VCRYRYRLRYRPVLGLPVNIGTGRYSHCRYRYLSPAVVAFFGPWREEPWRCHFTRGATGRSQSSSHFTLASCSLSAALPPQTRAKAKEAPPSSAAPSHTRAGANSTAAHTSSRGRALHQSAAALSSASLRVKWHRRRQKNNVNLPGGRP